MTIDLIEAAERGMRGSNVSVAQATRFAQAIRQAAEQTLGLGPELSAAKLTPRVTRQISDGKRHSIADSSTGEMPAEKRRQSLMLAACPVWQQTGQAHPEARTMINVVRMYCFSKGVTWIEDYPKSQ